MSPETAVVNIQGQYQIYTEFHHAEGAEKTIILVNGSLATTASFAQTVRYLYPHFNVVLYDQPYAGQSKPHNRHDRPISKEDEAFILLELIEHFAAEHVMSFSWGGAAALLALAYQPRRLEKAVITSFSAQVNTAMRGYLEQGVRFLGACDRPAVGNLINGTIGKHLPSLFKRFNHRHIISLAAHEYAQMHCHVSEVLSQDDKCYLRYADAIQVPLLFVNGELDEYTCTEDARLFTGHARECHFSTIANAGHFLDMEHKAAWLATQQATLGFLRESLPARRTTHTTLLLEPQAMAS
ncbi:MAG: alpha/beta hydrolase [Pseudomonadota bacterium]